MDTKERILSIRLMEAMKKQPEFSKRLQMKAVMKEPGRQARSDRNGKCGGTSEMRAGERQISETRISEMWIR